MTKLLKRIIPAIGLFLVTPPVHAQWATIPDTNFVNWLNSNGYAACLNGSLLDTTCSAVVNATKVICNNANIQDLDGIQYFDSLDTLRCRGNKLTMLPDLPPSLTILTCSENKLSSLPTLPGSLLYLNCETNPLHVLPALPQGMLELICSFDSLSALPGLPDSLITLICYNNQITSLPALPAKLSGLGCAWNNLTGLPALPSSLTLLQCNSNQISTLPALPSGLSSFYCDHNQLAWIPALPTSLLNFVCHNNNLTQLPALPVNLQQLHCFANQLTSLPSLNINLKDLECYSNQLSGLPPLNANLEKLYCHYNQLSSLPALPASLVDLICHTNPIGALPSLPASLKWLTCNDCQLTGLPVLPNSLISINCSANQITTLPALPAGLTGLDCGHNDLATIPQLPDSMYILYVNNNANLACLPRLNRIVNLQFQNTAVQCLPNYGTVTTSMPALASVPLCDLFNPGGCIAYWNISGRAYVDSSNNCMADPLEMRLGNLKVLLDSAGTLIQQTYTGGKGHYSFDTDLGSYVLTIDTAQLPVEVICPPAGMQTSVLTPIDSMDYDVDFGMECKPGFDVGTTSAVRDSGWIRPAHYAVIRISAGDISNFYGLHCAQGVSGTVRIVITGPASYAGPAAGALTPVVSGDTLTYSVADFGTLAFDNAFGIRMQTDTTAMAGASVCFDVAVMPLAGDLVPSNNTLQHCFAVTGSFDPNIKEVFPEGAILPTQEWLTYTVHFQNTGTAPAEHIYLLDTLDANLDVASFEFLAASHPAIVQLTGPVMRFNFPNINLPDSTSDEPGSHGFVQYRVRLKSGLPLGTVIANTAHIYFDFNPPVTTNTVTDTLALPAGIAPAAGPVSFAIHPNPVTEMLYVHFDENGASPDGTLTLFDPQGRKLWSVPVGGNERKITVDLHEMESGVYPLRYESYSGNVLTKKIILTH